MTVRDNFYIPENLRADRHQEVLSPSGKYRLMIDVYATTPGCWNVTRGTVYRVGSGEPLVTVDRNYGSFPFCWIEGHANGHDYLVCGANYQGQTVIELNTGRRHDYLPEAAKKGAGFCWSNYRYDATTQVLVVSGCHWACSYEFRLYDFSTPLTGWPEIEADDTICDDVRWPEREDDTWKFYQSMPDESDEDNAPPPPVAVTKTFRREGLKLVLVEEWWSEEAKENRRQSEEARVRWDAWLTEFKTKDPLYLTYRVLVQDPALSPDEYESHGITHSNWCPYFKTQETRWCRRIVTGDGAKHVSKPKTGQRWTVDLEWGAKTGPIKLVVFHDGKTWSVEWFDHSAEGMQKAFARAKALANGEVTA